MGYPWLAGEIAQSMGRLGSKSSRRLPNREEIEAVDFATDADLAMLRQEPLRARILLRTIGIVVRLVSIVGGSGSTR
jgi:adhesin transport system membrane fusion protein